MTNKKFVFSFFVVAAVFSCSIIGFNIIGNPFGVWDVCSVVGLNRYAVQGEAMERLAKPLAVARYKPETIFLGNSLINLGLNPKHYEELTGRRAYNFAVDSCHPYEMRRYLEHILAACDGVREVLIAVDISMLYPVEGIEAGFNESQIGRGYLSPELFAQAAFSLDTVRASYESMKVNRRERIAFASHNDDGQLSEGQQQRNYGNVWFYSFLQLNLRSGMARDKKLDFDNLKEYRRIKELCDEHGVEMKLYIPPITAAGEAAFADFYGEKAMRRFLSEITAIEPVYDFGGIGEWNKDESPSSHELFWEAHHMKSALGDKVLDVLAGNSAPPSWLGFGKIISATDVDDYIRAKNVAKDEWKASHPEMAREVSHLGYFAPMDIMDVPPSPDDFIHIDDICGKGRPSEIELSPRDNLRLAGWSMALSGNARDVYVVLKNEAGECRAALAAPVERNDVTSMFDNDSYKAAGFLCEASLKVLPPGEYEVRLLEMADGTKHLSRKVALLSVTK